MMHSADGTPAREGLSTETQAAPPLVAIVAAQADAERITVAAIDYPNLIQVAAGSYSAKDRNAAIRAIPADAAYFLCLRDGERLEAGAIGQAVALAEREPRIAMVGTGTGAAVVDGHELVRGQFRGQHTKLSAPVWLFRATKRDPGSDFYDPALKAVGDTDTNMRVALTGKVGFVPDNLATGGRAGETDGLRAAFDGLESLDRHGPYVLGYAEYRALRARSRRHYLRGLIKVRFAGDRATWDWHIKSLKGRDDAAGLGDFLAAALGL